MTHCHVSAQIAAEAERHAYLDEMDSYIEARIIQIATTGAADPGGDADSVTINDIINELGDDPGHNQAMQQAMQGNAQPLQAILERIAINLLTRETTQ